MALVALSQLREYELSGDTYDVRGWTVCCLVDAERVGTVEELIAAASGRPVYLDLALDAAGRHVLLPIGGARADPDRHRVWLPGLHRAALDELPSYDRRPETVTRADEQALLDAYRRALTGEAVAEPTGVVFEPRTAGEPELPRLAPISQLPDFRVADGDVDPRGWPIAGAADERVGIVSDLVVDTRAHKVRYLACDVDEAALGLEPVGRRILVPAGLAQLCGREHVVQVPDLTRENVAQVPIYDGQDLNRELEEELLLHYRPDTRRSRFYHNALFDADDFFGSHAR